MARPRKITGQCRICGEQTVLSFEHVPNREAYNKATVIEYSWQDVIVHRDRARGTIRQGGIGENTICEKCNNDTGHWYGAEYTGWARACFEFLKNRRPPFREPDEAEITLHDVYPLRFIKQVAVCFFSVTPGLANMHPQLVRFVLDKEEKQLPPNCQFFMNLFFGSAKPKLRRWPLAGKISVVRQGGQLIPITRSVFSEITHPPFELVMADERGFPHSGDITSFSNSDYSQAVGNLKLRLQVVHGDSPLPGSFD